MASLLIRNLDDRTKARLRLRAAAHARSMEEEAREILKESLRPRKAHRRDLGAAIHSYFASLGGLAIDLPPRGPARTPPDFRGPEYADDHP